MRLFDNTLRDGGNVVGHGFNRELTCSIIEGLIDAGITDIEYGNCKGLGSYTKLNATKALSDHEYFELIQPYKDKAKIGMFQVAALAEEDLVKEAAASGMEFLRVGASAGKGEGSLKAVEMVKKAGLTCRYSFMKGYLLSPSELAKEAALLEKGGVDKVTIMDSAGMMFPKQAAEYVIALKNTVSIPVGFHGHSNLGLSQANALAAVEAGADEIDCGLLGMARSAGNCCTELALATLQKEGYLEDADLYKLLHYLEDKLIPAIKPYNYNVAVCPVDLVLGLTGTHSGNLPRIEKIAKEKNVDLFKLIAAVAEYDRESPSEELISGLADKM